MRTLLAAFTLVLAMCSPILAGEQGHRHDAAAETAISSPGLQGLWTQHTGVDSKTFEGDERSVIVVMGENPDGSSTNNLYSKGNYVQVDTMATLVGVGVYLADVPAGTHIYWAVFETEGTDPFTSTFTKRHESWAESVGGTGYWDSIAPISVVLEPGKIYWLGAFWDQEVTYFFSNTLPGAPQSFPLDVGTMTYLGRAGTYSVLPAPETFEGSGNTNAPYWQRYYVDPAPMFWDGFETGDASGW